MIINCPSFLGPMDIQPSDSLFLCCAYVPLYSSLSTGLSGARMEWIMFLFPGKIPDPGITWVSCNGRWILPLLSHQENPTLHDCCMFPTMLGKLLHMLFFWSVPVSHCNAMKVPSLVVYNCDVLWSSWLDHWSQRNCFAWILSWGHKQMAAGGWRLQLDWDTWGWVTVSPPSTWPLDLPDLSFFPSWRRSLHSQFNIVACFIWAWVLWELWDDVATFLVITSEVSQCHLCQVTLATKSTTPPRTQRMETALLSGCRRCP